MSACFEENSSTASIKLCSVCLRLKNDLDAIRCVRGFISLCFKLLVIQRPALTRRVWTCCEFSSRNLCYCIGPSLLPGEKELDSPNLSHQV